MGLVKYEGDSFVYVELRLRDGDESHVCPYCERRMDSSWQARAARKLDSATIEHIVPISEGGTWALSNLVLCCKACNEKRGRLWDEH